MFLAQRLLVLCTLLLAGSIQAKEDAPFPPPPEDVASVATLVSVSEPGERLVIKGTVYKADRTTPLPDFVLYVYQTDATGRYNHIDGNWERPRIRGWVKTDSKGRYELRTIKPGAYPGGNTLPHIHVIVKLSGSEPKWIDDFLFADDMVRPGSESQRAAKNNFSHIMKIEKGDDGVLQCKRDIAIQ